MTKLAPVVFGSTITHSFKFFDGSGNAVDLTGGSVAVVYTATDGTTISKTATLSGTPSVVPQASVTLQEADYTALTAPFDLVGKATATTSGSTVFVEDEFVQPVMAPQGFGANGSLNTYSEALAGGLGTGSDRGVVETVLRESYDAIRSATGREFISAARTQDYDGIDSELVFLNAYPVTAVASVKLLDSDGTETTLDATSYRWDAAAGTLALTGARDVRYGADADTFGNPGYGRGVHRSPAFARSFRGVRVTYTGGYSAATVPYDLKRIELDYGRLLYAERTRSQGVVSESLGDYSYSRGSSSERSAILADLVRRYRRMVV